MRITKIHIFLLTFLISLVYGILVYLIFSSIHNQILGLSSALVSTGLLFIAGFHFSNFLFYKFYKKIVVGRSYEGSTFFDAKISIIINLKGNLIRDEIIQFFKVNKSKLRPLELFPDEGIFVLGLKQRLLEWDKLIFVVYPNNDSNPSVINFYYNSTKCDEIDILISFLKSRDLLNLEGNLN